MKKIFKKITWQTLDSLIVAGWVALGVLALFATSCQKQTQQELRQTNTCEECYRRIHTAPFPYNLPIPDKRDTFQTCEPDTIIGESYRRYQDSTGQEFDEYIYIDCH